MKNIINVTERHLKECLKEEEFDLKVGKNQQFVLEEKIESY